MSAYIPHGVLLALAASNAVQAHTTFSNLFINGEDQGTGNCIRMSTDLYAINSPVVDIGSSDMVCNVGGQSGVEGLCTISDGATIEVQWREKPDDPQSSSVVDPSHDGSCAVYMKKVDSALEDSGEGDGWFKIYEDGYDVGSDTWCVDKLIANDGKLSIQIPSGLQGGDYLLRPEIIALHRAYPGENTPEFYLGCAQITLESDGNSSPSETVSIPGYLDGSEPGLNVDLYDGSIKDGYEIPGPSVVGDNTASSDSNGSQEASDGSDNSADGDDSSSDNTTDNQESSSDSDTNNEQSNDSEDVTSGNDMGSSEDSYNEESNDSEDVASGNDVGSSDDSYNEQSETGSDDSTELYVDEDEGQPETNSENRMEGYGGWGQGYGGWGRFQRRDEGSDMYEDAETEANGSTNEGDPEYSQSSDSSPNESPDSYGPGMDSNPGNGFPSNNTDASGQGQEPCIPSTLVTVTVTATADGSNPTDSLEADGASPYGDDGASPNGDNDASPFGGEGDSPYGNADASPYGGEGASPNSNEGASSYGAEGSQYGRGGASPYMNRGSYN